jgi:hypothetical protein
VQKNFRPDSGLATICKGNRHPGLATQRSRLRRGLHPNSTQSPPPRLESVVTPSLEVRAQWAAKLRVSSGSGPEPVGTTYGLVPPEPLDMYRVAALHGFSDLREAVDWCLSERAREARELQARGDSGSP